MTSVRLVARSDEYDNSPGLMLAGLPSLDGAMADRTDGILIAHDILEHQNGVRNIGTVWDELEALGGIWEVRGRHGDLMNTSIHSPHHNIAADVSRMFGDWKYETRQRCDRTRCCLYDDDFREILDEARRSIRYEFDPGQDRVGMDAYLDEALHRLRIGFRKARRRFNHEQFTGYEMFRHVKEAAASAVKMIDFEGQEFVLTYSRNEARVRPVYGDFE